MGDVCVGKKFPLDFDELERDVVLTDEMLICGLDTGIDTWVSVGNLTKPERIDFTNDAFPGLLNYRTAIIPLTTLTWLARFGEYPQARLFWFDENGDWIPWQQPPKYGVVAGVLDSIVWNIGDPITGFIIISR